MIEGYGTAMSRADGRELGASVGAMCAVTQHWTKPHQDSMCTFHIDSLNFESSLRVLSGCFFS